MPCETRPALQRVLVFTSDHPHAPNLDLADLQRIFPEAELTMINPSKAAWLLLSQGDTPVDWLGALHWLRQHQFNAAIVLTAPGQSPYTLGYLCYLAGIPLRIGHSHEFGGQVLSHCSPPPDEGDCKQLLALLREASE